MSLLRTARISFIGLGNMNSAVLAGVLDGGHEAANVRATVGRILSAETKAAQLGVEVTATEAVPDANPTVTGHADLVVLGVKPHGIMAVCEEISASLRPESVVVSVAAGITLDAMAAHLPAGQPLVRAMPNTPLTVGQGSVGLAANQSVTDDQLERAKGVFEHAGAVFVVPEDQINLVGAISGSGPAYFFHLTELLAQAAADQGMDTDVAEAMAAATLSGAGAMIESQNKSAAELREDITSPNGTTEAALKSFDDHDLAGVVRRAIEVNMHRSEQLAQEFGA